MTITPNTLKAITAAELRDGMTIQHPGSGQVLTVSDVKDDGTATGGKHWTGRLKDGDQTPYQFNAPLNFPLYQIQDEQPAEMTEPSAEKPAATFALTQTMIDGLECVLQMGANDQENYFDDGSPQLDYTAEDLRESKATAFEAAASAATALGLDDISTRFQTLAKISRDLATSMENGYKCTACGRDEDVCSANPCADVIADREA